MKNFKQKIVTTLFAIAFMVLSVISTYGALEASSSSLSSSFLNEIVLAEDETENNEKIVQDSLFLVDLGFVKVYGNYIYVYDKADSTIKIIDKATGTFKEDYNHYRLYNLKDIIVYNNILMMYNGESFTCITLNSFETVTFNQTELSTIQTAKTIKIVSIAQKDYIVLCPENPIADSFEIAEISVDNNVISVSNIKTFKIGEQFQASLSEYNHIYITESEEMLFVMLVNDQNIFSFKLDIASVEQVYTVTAVTGLETNGDEILDISAVTLSEEADALAVTTTSLVKFYTLEISPSSASLSHLEGKDILIEANFIASDADGNMSTLSLISNENQSVIIYNFDTKQPSGYEQNELKNGEINTTFVASDQFLYLDVIKATSIQESPYSKDAIVTAEVNDNLVVIGEGFSASTGEPIVGWYYVMYSLGSTNYYGYVASIDTTILFETEFENTYTTVLAFTKLYTMPSVIEDDLNTQIRVIPNSSRLEVLSPICDYSSLNTKYLLVRVNGTDVGFIDRSRIIESSSLEDRIIPNATVLRNNSEIFTSTSEDRETILMLNKGARVKVIGKRDTITNFTLVTFNDEEGNVYTGYIYTYNLEADTWTMLQIIGMLLVTINVILLIVIICIKNKVTR